MTILEIIELCVVGVFVVIHVVANFYNARCSCKLCSTIRQFFGRGRGSDDDSSDDVHNEDDRTLLIQSFLDWIDSHDKE